jgi:hypothetical protein
VLHRTAAPRPALPDFVSKTGTTEFMSDDDDCWLLAAGDLLPCSCCKYNPR